MKFEPRTTVPANGNKYYISTKKGGYNKCVMRDDKTGNVLPNCCGYSYARFMECQEITKCKLSANNAETWYNHKDGYKRGQTPKLGAVACWRSGSAKDSKDGAGHVANVEKVYSDGSYLISESNYSGSPQNGRYFKTLLVPKTNKMGSKIFQGFIYPDTVFDTKISDKYYRKGDRGCEIELIDQWLYEKYGNSKVLGKLFGINTEKYVKKFQIEAKANGTYKDNIDGVIGPLTLKAMRLAGFPY